MVRGSGPRSVGEGELALDNLAKDARGHSVVHSPMPLLRLWGMGGFALAKGGAWLWLWRRGGWSDVCIHQGSYRDGLGLAGTRRAEAGYLW